MYVREVTSRQSDLTQMETKFRYQRRVEDPKYLRNDTSSTRPDPIPSLDICSMLGSYGRDYS